MVAISKISSPLARSSYSCEWLVNSLRKEDESFRSRLKESSIKTITYQEVGEGTGFMSKVYRVEVHFEKQAKPYTVIFKVPQAAAVDNFIDMVTGVVDTVTGAIVQKKKNRIAMDATLLHQREVQFYEIFKNANGVPLPKVYVAEKYVENKQDGTILMENLCENGTLSKFTTPCNVAQLLNLLNVVANFDAATLTKLSPTQIQKCNISLTELETRREMAKIVGAEAICRFPEVVEEPLTKLKNIVEKDDYFQYIATSGINRDLDIPAVLTHGDLHPNNIFWRKNPDGTCSDEIYAIIDWQTVFAGTVGHDLSFLMLLNFDGETRRQCEMWLFDYFHAVLKSELHKKGKKMPFTVEQIRRSYRWTFVYNVCFLISVVPAFAKSADQNQQAKCLKRVRCALDDAVTIMQQDLPQFL